MHTQNSSLAASSICSRHHSGTVDCGARLYEDRSPSCALRRYNIARFPECIVVHAKSSASYPLPVASFVEVHIQSIWLGARLATLPLTISSLLSIGRVKGPQISRAQPRADAVASYISLLAACWSSGSDGAFLGGVLRVC